VETEVVLPTVDIHPVIMIMMTENLIKVATAIVVEEAEVVGALLVVSRATFPGNVLIRMVAVEVEVEAVVVEDLVAEPDALNVGKKDTSRENVLIMVAEEIVAKAAVAEEEVVAVLTVEKRVTFPGNALMPEEIRAGEEEEVAAVAAQEEVDVLTVESKVIFQESVLKVGGIKQNVRK